jgi:hypothetical protein
VITIAGDRDTHAHHPHPPTPGTLRFIGAAAYRAAQAVCSRPNLAVTATPVGVFSVEVTVRYDNPVFGRFGFVRLSVRRARRAAARLREIVLKAVAAATKNLGLPGVRVHVEVSTRQGGAS